MQKFSLSVLISLLACLGRPTKLKISLKMAFFAEWQKQKGLLAFEGLLKLPNDFAAKHDRDINYPLTMWQAAEIQLKLLTKATMKKTNEIRRSYTCNQMAMAQSHSQNSESREILCKLLTGKYFSFTCVTKQTSQQEFFQLLTCRRSAYVAYERCNE